MVDNLSDWRLASTLNVFEIALLLKGYHPADYADSREDNWPDKTRRETYALIQTIQREAVEGRVEAKIQNYDHGDAIDWSKTVIVVASVDAWLLSRGYPTLSAMLSGETKTKSITDKTNPYFALKLAAAIRAWEYISAHPATLYNKRPKTAIREWLEGNAAELGLVKPDGTINQTAISEIAAVANWDQSGGAPATGMSGGVSLRFNPNPPEIIKNPPEVDRKSQGDSVSWDDEIPF